jgi:hydroxymethylpyrimidine/phosphomethylpyrimidine kinase
MDVEDEHDMQHAADAILLKGASAVLITGGHLKTEYVIDLLRTADGLQARFESERLDTTATHGTGCTLSAAVAAGLAQGLTLEGAVRRGIEFVHQAMRFALPLGRGPHTPLDHGFTLRQRPLEEPVH